MNFFLSSIFKFIGEGHAFNYLLSFFNLKNQYEVEETACFFEKATMIFRMNKS